MTWTVLSVISVKQDWQITPVLPTEAGYFRFSFATAGIPVWIAQCNPTTLDIYDERRITATAYAQILEFEAPPFFSDRALALRVPNFATPFQVQIEVSSMPFISSGGSSSGNATSVATAGNVTTVDASTNAVTLLAANAARKKLIVINSSTAIMYLAFGETATVAEHTIAVGNGDGYELEGYTGIVSAIWAAATGKAMITEFS